MLLCGFGIEKGMKLNSANCKADEVPSAELGIRCVERELI